VARSYSQPRNRSAIATEPGRFDIARDLTTGKTGFVQLAASIGDVRPFVHVLAGS